MIPSMSRNRIATVLMIRPSQRLPVEPETAAGADSAASMVVGVMKSSFCSVRIQSDGRAVRRHSHRVRNADTLSFGCAPFSGTLAYRFRDHIVTVQLNHT